MQPTLNNDQSPDFAKLLLSEVEIQRLLKLEIKALNFISTIRNATNDDLFAGNSGGKDSAIVDFLLQKSKIIYKSYHTNTTLDPPGTIPHLKMFYPHTEILKPNETFYQLIRRKGLPTRLNRYCCEHLKEYGSVEKMVFEGVRSAESKNRQGRDYIQCDNRKWQKGAQHVYIIYDWTDIDVWNYIKFRNIILAPHYELAKKEGLTRLGCVGCPLVKTKTRQKEFKLYPKILQNITKAIESGMKDNPQWKLSVATEGNAEIAIQWWLSGKTMNQFFKTQLLTGSKKDGWTSENMLSNQTKLKL